MIEIIKVLINNLKKNLFKDISVVAFSMLNWSNFLIFHKDVKYSFIIMNCGFFCVFCIFPKSACGMTPRYDLSSFVRKFFRIWYWNWTTCSQKKYFVHVQLILWDIIFHLAVGIVNGIYHRMSLNPLNKAERRFIYACHAL